MNTIVLNCIAFAFAAPALRDLPAEPATIEGEWAIESILLGGEDNIRAQPPIDKIVITADRWIVVRRGIGNPGAEIAIDSKKNPPRIDIGITDGKVNSKGIFKLEGDTLMVCWVLDGERPKKFESPINSRIRLLTLKRIKR
jgi:uncharacterized protein (TIGR03067 family)